MKKKIIISILSFCMIFSNVFIMSACDDKITDIAYVQFIPNIENEVVQYTSRMYGNSDDSHIYLFESEEKRTSGDWKNNCLLKIIFKRNCGVDFTIDKNDTMCVDIEGWSSMSIWIKEEYYYNSTDKTPKKVYLNGIDITSKAKPDPLSKGPIELSPGNFSDGYYYFEDFGLIKGNTSNYINKIEYK